MNKCFLLPLVFGLLWPVALVAEDFQYSQNFEKLEFGDPPDELFVVEGDFQVIAMTDVNKALKLPAIPLVENGALFGKSSKGAMTAEVRVKGEKKRRSYPRFALGVHGISGYRLRVVPAKKQVELVKDEEVVHTAPYTWTTAAWCQMKISVSTDAVGKTVVQGWVWSGSDAVPEKPSITLVSDEAPGQGKASIWGSPYSGKDIVYDDLKVIIPEAKK